MPESDYLVMAGLWISRGIVVDGMKGYMAFGIWLSELLQGFLQSALAIGWYIRSIVIIHSC